MSDSENASVEASAVEAATTAVDTPATEEVARERTRFIVLPEVMKRKEDLYEAIKQRLNEQVISKRGTGAQVFGDTHTHDIVVSVWEGFFRILTQLDAEGQAQVASLGIPNGYGSLKLMTAAATKKRTPQGAIVQVPKRWRAVWRPGKRVEEILDTLPPPKQDAPVEVPAEAAVPSA